MKEKNLRSEKVRKIVGKMPHVIVRYGIGVIMLGVLTLFAISNIIPYEETVSIDVSINPAYSPAKVTAELKSDEILIISKGMLLKADFLGEECEMRVDSISSNRINGRYLVFLSITSNDIFTRPTSIIASAKFSRFSYFEKLFYNPTRR